MKYKQKYCGTIRARFATLFIAMLSIALLAGCGYTSDQSPEPLPAPSPEPLATPYTVGGMAEIRDGVCVGEAFVGFQGNDDPITTGITCSMNGTDLAYEDGSIYYTATIPDVDAGESVVFSINCGAGNMAIVTATVPDAPTITSPVSGGSYASGVDISVSWNTAMAHAASLVYIAVFCDGTLISTSIVPFADGSYEFIGGFSSAGSYEIRVSTANSAVIPGVNFFNSVFWAANRSSVTFSVN